jgi:hypothetical protein
MKEKTKITTQEQASKYNEYSWWQREWALQWWRNGRGGFNEELYFRLQIAKEDCYEEKNKKDKV